MHQHHDHPNHAGDDPAAADGDVRVEHCWYEGGPFRDELTSHLPFSVLSVAIGLVLAGLICFFADAELLAAAEAALEQAPGHDHDHDHGPGDAHAAEGGHAHGGTRGFLILFHLFHPAHMLFSAAATAAMFWRYERSTLKAVLVGFSGAVVVCGISDIAMPALSVWLMDKPVPRHICIVDHPMLVVPFAALGVLLGIAAASGGTVHSTIFSHSLHVSASTMASIFYIIGPFGRLAWINDIGTIFFFVCLAVVLPCCLSDIVYPLMFTRRAREEYSRSGHQHPH